MLTLRKTYRPYASPLDPCPPIAEKVYDTPQNIYVHVQPSGLQQFDPCTALRKGTLWPALYNPYYGRSVVKGVEHVHETNQDHA